MYESYYKTSIKLNIISKFPLRKETIANAKTE